MRWKIRVNQITFKSVRENFRLSRLICKSVRGKIEVSFKEIALL